MIKHTKSLYVSIRVNGQFELREAYFEISISKDISGRKVETSKLKPKLNPNEVLIESSDKEMEIVRTK